MSKRIWVDIDETICFYDGVDRLGYKNAIPNYDNIDKINKLYDEGNYIKYWTGRGIVSKVDYYELTKPNVWWLLVFTAIGAMIRAGGVGEKFSIELEIIILVRTIGTIILGKGAR